MMLTVICVCTIDPTNWKRPVYSKMWVDRLYSAINRNLHLPFEFVCLSNDLTQQQCNYRVIPLTTDSWGWWNKLDMFRSGLFTGPCLYIDLDVVICKDLTEVIKNLPQDLVLMPKEPYSVQSDTVNKKQPYKYVLNSSVVYWNGDYSVLYNHYVNDRDNIVKKYSNWTEQQPNIGDQKFICDTLLNTAAFDDYVPNNFFGWKHHNTGTVMQDPSMLVFTSTEKPSNNLDLEVVQLNWID